jgi:hypothetical protein
MEAKVKENGQAKVAQTVTEKKAAQFVAGNPVNKVSEKNQVKEQEQGQAVKGDVVDENKAAAQSPAEAGEGAQAAKVQVNAVKPALNLDETLKLVADLSKKTALRDRYNGYIEQLKAFVIAQNDEDDMAKHDTSFKGCELTIRDGEGNVFHTESAAVISGTVDFMSGRFTERLAEVEAEIVIPA